MHFIIMFTYPDSLDVHESISMIVAFFHLIKHFIADKNI